MESLNALCTLGDPPASPKESFQSLYTVAFSMFFVLFLKHVFRLLLKHRNTEQLKTSTSFAFLSDLFTASSKNPLAHFGCLKGKIKRKKEKKEREGKKKKERKTLEGGK